MFLSSIELRSKKLSTSRASRNGQRLPIVKYGIGSCSWWAWRRLGRHRPKSCLEIHYPSVVLPLAIDFFTVSDLDDQNDQFLVLDRVDDPIIAFADTVEMVFTG